MLVNKDGEILTEGEMAAADIKDWVHLQGVGKQAVVITIILI